MKTQFIARDCALIGQSAGVKAQTLKEFRDGIGSVPIGSIYQHFWGRLLRPNFDEPEYSNDFASWVYHALGEKPLAERLSAVHPSDFNDLEELRSEIVELIDARLDEIDVAPWTVRINQFYFLKSQMVVFDTGIRIGHPSKLGSIVSELSTGSIFYHFIDARRRTTDKIDDFSQWLSEFGAECRPLVDRLSEVDPFFSSLREIRLILSEIFNDSGDAS